MDSGFDMHTAFSEQKSRSNIAMLLKSVNLEKYADLLSKKDVDYHTFVNMSRDDMRNIGVINSRDQDALVAITKPLLAMYHELEPRPVRYNKVLTHTRSFTKVIAGVLVQLRNELSAPDRDVQLGLVDSETTCSEAILNLLQLIDSRIDLIREDLDSIKEKRALKPYRSKSIIAASGVLLATVAGLLLWKRHFRIFSFKW